MHAPELRHKAVALIRSGVSNAEVSRRLGLPVGTVSYWIHVDRVKCGEAARRRPSLVCPRCDGRVLDRAAYAYLLGLYLGDGYISHYAKHRTPSLQISCDDVYPGLIEDVEATLRRVFPHNSPCRVRGKGCHHVKVYSRHADCLFPQHGPGKKHERPIVLEPWQREIVDAHPWEFIRGLVHSDGCRITNWTTRVVGGVRKRYEYPRYFFTNVSADIRRLYCDALDRVGVEWKVTRRGGRPYNMSVAREESVALMDLHVGAKH